METNLNTSILEKNQQAKNSYKEPVGNVIKEKEHIKNLGVIISDDLTWSKHITEVVSKATVMSGWVLRTFSTRDRDPMVTMWNSQVRSILDYCSPLWSPRPKDLGNIDLIENTQRAFTRSIDGMEGLDYAQRLKKLSMYSVQRRHERYRIIYIYKIKEGLVPNVSESHGLQFLPNENAATYGLNGKEKYTVQLPEQLTPGMEVIVMVSRNVKTSNYY